MEGKKPEPVIIRILRKCNRTLLEMWAGMVVYGIPVQVAGLLLARRQGAFTLSLWVGIVLAMAGSLHMYRTLDGALDAGGASVNRVFAGYLIRYVSLGLVLVVWGMKMEPVDVLVLFAGYMSLKVTALIWPFIHKISNQLFHETDAQKDSQV